VLRVYHLDPRSLRLRLLSPAKPSSQLDTDSAAKQSPVPYRRHRKWSSTKWQLTISHSKCNILHLGNSEPILNFFISGIPILEASHTTDLGVLFDPDLKFKTHISDIVKRAKQRASLIHRCFISRDIKNLIRAFKTYVRPLVEYAPQIWSPHLTFLIDLIEGVQRAFTKRLPGFANKTYAERLKLLQIQSLEHRRLLYDLTLCFNIVHGFTALSFDDFFSLSNIHPPEVTLLNLLFQLLKLTCKNSFSHPGLFPYGTPYPKKLFPHPLLRNLNRLFL